VEWPVIDIRISGATPAFAINEVVECLKLWIDR
jgi:hypothetical protein